MRELMPVFIFGLICAWFSEQRSIYRINDRNEKVYVKKDVLFYSIMSIVMAGFAGLRTWYNDTVTYCQGYEMISSDIHKALISTDWSLGENPGFSLVNIILKYFGVSTQTFIMLYSLFTVLVYLWFLRKYTNNIWMTIFFFFTMGCYTFTLAAIKQCVAVAFSLIAIDRLIQEKRLSFIIWILFASTFHAYALMYLLAPFLFFKPWTKYTYLMLGLALVLGMGLEQMLGTIVDITSMMGEEYDMASFSGEGVNILRLAVIWAPILLSLIASSCLKKSENKEKNLILNLSMLNAEIMFIALFGTANYFARLANYFLIFQTIMLPNLFGYFNKKSRKVLVLGTIVCYFVYFYYANVINQPFDMQFERMTLGEYIYSVF